MFNRGQRGLSYRYDMCKAVDKGMTIEAIGSDEKLGGKSGEWRKS